ncbi:MAG: Hsp70 family protein, partial [Luteibacter sp.]
PQIEVTFDIDANGILHVSAKDKDTGKEQKIEIKAGSGLSDEEVARMVADAEANREEDKKFHELVQVKNRGDQLVHATRSQLKEHGGKIPAEQLATIDGAVSDLEKALGGEDKDAIEAKITNLEQVAQALSAAAQQGGAQDTAQQSAPGGGSAQPDDVVDAEFTEVKDDKK